MQFTLTRLITTASTNDDAKAAALSGVGGGHVVWALSQTSGRGRQGRQWHSPEGNLYMSVVLRPCQDQQQYGLYSFIAALAISDAVATFLPSATIEHKWPNDVLVEGEKISGLLLEAGDDWLVVGIGLNVRCAPENTLYPVTCLARHMERPDVPDVERVLREVLDALSERCALFTSHGFEAIRAAWLARARRGHLCLRSPRGDAEGDFAGLDADGRLRIRGKDGVEQAFSVGDVFFDVKPASGCAAPDLVPKR